MRWLRAEPRVGVVVGTVGIEWVQDYHSRTSNLDNTKAQAEGFYNTLSAIRAFNWGDDLAWDQDFEQAGKGTPAQGTDTDWAENVDFVFFSGHGSPQGFMFGVKKWDNAGAGSREISWGEGDLDWIALDACEVLSRDDIFARWGWPVFNGLHMILGFHTTCSDEPDRGRLLAQYLNAGWTVRQAWIRACQDTEDSDVTWAYLRADGHGTDTYNDHWWGKGHVSEDPDNPTSLFYARAAC